MFTTPPIPPQAVTAALGIQIAEDLGGRRNWHWLVGHGDERLILRRWGGAADDIAYEARLLAGVAALGWPVAAPLTGPLAIDGAMWSLFPRLLGEPPDTTDPQTEMPERGRLMASFHADLARLSDPGQRPGYRRGEAILADEGIDRILAAHERERPETVRIVRWHLDRARARIGTLRPHARPDQIIHGDFTPWNLRFRDSTLVGILDFELAHRDHRIADFALPWRGKHDAIIYAYNEIAPLDPEEWELLTPLWWGHLIALACEEMTLGITDQEWTLTHLLRRSPLMGVDAAPYPG